MNKKELKSKIHSLNYKIQAITSNGGIVPQNMEQELVTLKEQFKLAQESNAGLERKFIQEFVKVQDQFKKKLDKIYKQMDEVIALSEKTGIPFESEVKVFNDQYYPKTFLGKIDDLDYDDIKDLMAEHNFYMSYSVGWQHSMSSC